MLKLCPTLLPKFKGFCSSPSVIMLFVYMKSCFSLSYRGLEEMMMIRRAEIGYSTLQKWVQRFVCLIDKRVRQRKKPVNGSWRMDETYLKLNGKCVYLYRVVDKEGYTVDFLLRARRDAVAAKGFFRKTFKENGRAGKVIVDKSGSNKEALDYFNKDVSQEEKIEVRQIKYLNNIAEQDHRFIKKRTKLTLGFKNFFSAKETISGIENIRMIQKGHYLRSKPFPICFQQFCDSNGVVCQKLNIFTKFTPSTHRCDRITFSGEHYTVSINRCFSHSS